MHLFLNCHLNDAWFCVAGCESLYSKAVYFPDHLVQEACKTGLTRSDHFVKWFNHTEKLVYFN